MRAVFAIPVALGLIWLVAGDALEEAALLSGRSIPGAASAALDARDAERRLVRGDAVGAEQSATAALARAPLMVSAIRTLGLARMAADDPAGGRTLMLLAGQLGWRDQQTQLWLFATAAQQGDFAVAIQRADALLRQDLITSRVLPLLRAMIRVPAAADALADTLSDPPGRGSDPSGPAWRYTFFGDMSSLSEAGFADQIAMYDRVAARGAKPSRRELLPFVNRLTHSDRVPTAYAVWRKFARRPEAGPAVAIDDGDFSAPPIDDPAEPRFPFEWALDDAGGGASSVQPAPSGSGGLAFRAEASGASVTRIINQALLLPPGRYRLSYRALGESPEALGTFRWSLRCGETDMIGSAATRTGAGSAGWGGYAVTFAIPSSGCIAQDLELVARNVGSGPGVAWFDRLGIERL